MMGLRIGQVVRLSGTLLTARDAAHQRLVSSLEAGEAIPVCLDQAVLYYVGPAPARPGRPVGSAGPTTARRMDPYTPCLLAQGVKGMIGKGPRSEQVQRAMRDHGAVYFAAPGGAGALLAQCIVQAEVLAYPELGPEAIHRLEVREFPAVVAGDRFGGNLYDSGPKTYVLG